MSMNGGTPDAKASVRLQDQAEVPAPRMARLRPQWQT